jgi:hypothetical protein
VDGGPGVGQLLALALGQRTQQRIKPVVVEHMLSAQEEASGWMVGQGLVSCWALPFSS